MSQSNNISTQQAICNAAFRLFLEEGYENTTYERIAQESGTKKTNVQYYFPKKYQLFVLLTERLLDEIFILISDWPEDRDRGEIETMLYVGLLYYSFLLADEKTRRLTLEAFFYRDVTNELLTINANWVFRSFPFLNTLTDSKEELQPALIIASNGTYDFIYYMLKNDQSFDASYALELGLRTFFALVPQENIGFNFVYEKPPIDQATLNASIDHLKKSLMQ